MKQTTHRTEPRSFMIDELRKELIEIKIDGASNIARSPNRVLALIWLSIMLASASSCVFLIYGSINEYLTFPVSTIIRLYHDQQALFPVVTLCHSNRYWSQGAVDLFAEANISFTFDSLFMIHKLQAHELNKTGHLLSDERKKMLSDLDSALLECSYGPYACNSSDFEWVWDPFFFGCYRFNSGRDANNKPVELRRAQMAGLSSRLSLTLYAGLPDEISRVNSEDSHGFYVFISNQSYYPFSPFRQPITIAPGMSAEISIEREFYEQFNVWPYKYSECRVTSSNELLGRPIKDTYLFDEVVSTNYSYARATCYTYCAQEYIVRECGCNIILIDYQAPPVDKFCIGVQEYNCAFNHLNIFANSDYAAHNCSDKCPLECANINERNFIKTFVFSPYPSAREVGLIQSKAEYIAKVGQQNDFRNNLAINLVSFSVTYNSLAYTKIDEKAQYSWESLLGTIGGHLHLFLGMSLLSFVEIIEFFIKMCLHIKK